MDTTYWIRAAVPEDLESVLALERAIEMLPHWRLADYASALAPATQGPDMPCARHCFLVAEMSHGIVGFSVAKVAGTEAELESVGVAEVARRSGIGRALCTKVLEWSREMGAAEIELEVRSRSAGAIALYESLGFTAVGLRARYYRSPMDDAVLMRLGLVSQAVP